MILKAKRHQESKNQLTKNIPKAPEIGPNKEVITKEMSDIDKPPVTVDEGDKADECEVAEESVHSKPIMDEAYNGRPINSQNNASRETIAGNKANEEQKRAFNKAKSTNANSLETEIIKYSDASKKKFDTKLIPLKERMNNNLNSNGKSQLYPQINSKEVKRLKRHLSNKL
jgi:hypothetical protein